MKMRSLVGRRPGTTQAQEGKQALQRGIKESPLGLCPSESILRSRDQTVPFESITAALLLDRATQTLGTIGKSDGLRSVPSRLLKRSWDDGKEYDVRAME